jgi:hypothetical protein
MIKKKKLDLSKIGYYPESEHWIMCDETGKTWNGAPVKSRTIWEVNLPDKTQFTCDNQYEAEMMCLVAQVIKKLERIERKLKR